MLGRHFRGDAAHYFQDISNQLLIAVNLNMESCVASEMCATHVCIVKIGHGFSPKSKTVVNTKTTKVYLEVFFKVYQILFPNISVFMSWVKQLFCFTVEPL